MEINLGVIMRKTIEEGIKNTISWIKGLPFAPEELLNQEVLRNWE